MARDRLRDLAVRIGNYLLRYSPDLASAYTKVLPCGARVVLNVEDNVSTLKIFLEDVCVYGLPSSTNSVGSYFEDPEPEYPHTVSSSTRWLCSGPWVPVIQEELTAHVLGLLSDGSKATSIWNKLINRKKGETVTAPNFCDDRFNQCAPGIHFFITRREAEDFNY